MNKIRPTTLIPLALKLLLLGSFLPSEASALHIDVRKACAKAGGCMVVSAIERIDCYRPITSKIDLPKLKYLGTLQRDLKIREMIPLHCSIY